MSPDPRLPTRKQERETLLSYRAFRARTMYWVSIQPRARELENRSMSENSRNWARGHSSPRGNKKKFEWALDSGVNPCSRSVCGKRHGLQRFHDLPRGWPELRFPINRLSALQTGTTTPEQIL